MIKTGIGYFKRTLNIYKYWFSNQNDNNSKSEPDLSKIYIDKERILKKMQQIKNRNFKTENPDLMPKYKIRMESPQILKFRQQTQSQVLFAFKDPSLEVKLNPLQINSFSQESVVVQEVEFPPSLILLKNQIFFWQVQQISDIKLHHFDILKLIQPVPKYVIIGLKKTHKLDNELRQNLKKLVDEDVDVDVLQPFEAITSYNHASADLIDVVLFIKVN